MKVNLEPTTTGVPDSSEDLLKPDFLRDAKKELEQNGFISDEHDFAPYGEALAKHVGEIERELRRIGFGGHLMSGKIVNHPTAGYAYYLYDTSRFSADEAETAVAHWLDQRYPAETRV